MTGDVSAADKPLTSNQQRWLNHLKACDAQGCSSVAYAREHGLSVAALYAARKDLTHRGVYKASGMRRRTSSSAPVTLIPVQVRNATAIPSAPSVLRVVLPNGVVIEVPEHAEPGRCAGLVSALSGVAR